MMGPIYAITDPEAPLSMLEQARAAAQGGAWAVQLRDKHSPDDQLVQLAQTLVAELRPLGVKVIVNDRLKVALAADVDGLHMGQGDGDPRRVRAHLGPNKLLGLSIETLEQCRLIPAGIDYVGVGPVRPTPTKPDHAEPVGFDGLAAIIQQLKLPAFAIGGIGLADAAAIKHSGAVGMAVVSAITRAQNPIAATQALLQAWRSA